ncbi:hydroxyethylthiazole kinase [Pontibacter diazotrophicus]|uniref:Hydroxyethylthiazole kinase n=1 Tax=Pontibacter diazotrophicus TaxID=1400979 RepID=A0A3D8LB90_9BACT|nr:hydroxyethylthiazole kinase [Pontibacter diazotrophicus]RDV14564.1 hydroxyethylthiazole kinase [Pontibacter diazotrophicus]
MKEQLWSILSAVRQNSPLVHNITNYVVMNNTANALLAAGASPVMAHAHSEVSDMVSIAGALVVNIGTLDEYWVESMKLAVKQANALQKAWVLDPVGAGATSYRNNVLEELLSYRPTVIRGNASEIMALAKFSSNTKGVDSTSLSEEALEAAQQLSETTSAVVCVSGATDYIVNKSNYNALSNGHVLMSRITGMGCTASALVGACCAVSADNAFAATTAAMALMGIAGDIAAEKAPGPGTMQVQFLDALYQLSEYDFRERLKLETNP